MGSFSDTQIDVRKGPTLSFRFTLVFVLLPNLFFGRFIVDVTILLDFISRCF